MAIDTSYTIRQQVIYQIFPRNHSIEGNFQGVIKDLPRIHAMGVDIIYLLPIHPIGMKHRKGDMGSPYAIQDYTAINLEYGTLEDFQALIASAHDLGLKVMMDIVINHTAPDHPWVESHPEYYYKKTDGKMGNKVGDWSDILDLDYNNRDLQNEMIQMLVHWATLGVDGFRCDVASFVPLVVWKIARTKVSAINPDVIWLAESVHKEFLRSYRNEGYMAHSDGELYQAFDVCYDYDIHSEFMKFMEHQISIEEYASMLRLQDSIYPANYSKLRFLENHDQPRLHQICQDEGFAAHWIAFSFFQKGTAFLYAGQEAGAIHRPSLFTKDLIDVSHLKEQEMAMYQRLSAIKKRDIVARHICYDITTQNNGIMMVTFKNKQEQLLGFFQLMACDTKVQVDLPDGVYTNLFDDGLIIIQGGCFQLDQPTILSVF